MERRQFSEKDVDAVHAFFLEMNREDKMYINWNWARFEWMYWHKEFDKSLENSIGLWMEGDRVVGLATYDQYFGEGFVGTLAGYDSLLPEILTYAYDELKDENGLGIAVNDKDRKLAELAGKQDFEIAEQTENMMRLSLEKPFALRTPKGLSVREIVPEKDGEKYGFVLWQGFDHGSDREEFLRENTCMIPPRKHFRQELCLAVVDNQDNFVAHCQGWLAEDADYLYIEPVCVIPQARGSGVGSYAVKELLNRAMALGAKQAYVISDNPFYAKLGFKNDQHYTFWWKK